MGRRSPSSCDQEAGLKKGPWTPEEDKLLIDYVQKNGHGRWRRLSKLAGLNRCGKSCRLRWNNYLRSDIKRGPFTDEEEKLIIHLHSILGNKWSSIATKLPGRTDNEIKNYWNTHLRKKLLNMGIDPVTHRPRTDLINILSAGLPNLLAAVNLDIIKLQLLLSAITAAATPGVDITALLAAVNNVVGVSCCQLAGVDQHQGTSSGGHYDGLLVMNGATGGGNMAPPPLVAADDECNNNACSCCNNGTTSFEKTPLPSSSSFQGLIKNNLNLDDHLLINDNSSLLQKLYQYPN
ncbi:hypothetical protein QOZ80_6AG0506260 [Eleusine coracana subsp. coracana]|nr:hypothetical protein QOZ80_6AG0506260 [Eleusine coracana subsp. coracana]